MNPPDSEHYEINSHPHTESYRHVILQHADETCSFISVKSVSKAIHKLDWCGIPIENRPYYIQPFPISKRKKTCPKKALLARIKPRTVFIQDLDFYPEGGRDGAEMDLYQAHKRLRNRSRSASSRYVQKAIARRFYDLHLSTFYELSDPHTMDHRPNGFHVNFPLPDLLLPDADNIRLGEAVGSCCVNRPELMKAMRKQGWTFHAGQNRQEFILHPPRSSEDSLGWHIDQTFRTLNPVRPESVRRRTDTATLHGDSLAVTILPDLPEYPHKENSND